MNDTVDWEGVRNHSWMYQERTCLDRGIKGHVTPFFLLRFLSHQNKVALKLTVDDVTSCRSWDIQKTCDWISSFFCISWFGRISKLFAVLLLKDELDPQKPLKIGDPKRKVVFQPSMFRCELLVSGRVCHKAKRWFVISFRKYRIRESEARLFAFAVVTQTLVICCMQGITWLHRDYSKPLWGSLQAPTQSQPFKERGDTTVRKAVQDELK